MKLPLTLPARSRRGISLVQCLVYIALLGVLISIGGYTVAKAWDQSRGLAHNTDDIQKTLSIGEHWRSDIRAATGRIVSTSSKSNQTVIIPTRAGEVAYEFRDGQLSRRADKSAAWVCLYETVQASQMSPFAQDNVMAWRWEIELKSSYKKVRIRPQFTFTAVPTPKDLP